MSAEHVPGEIAGVYRHFKGGIYEVIDVARHSETEGRMVVYRSPSGELWVRPFEMFFEHTVVDGVATPRFTRIGAPTA